MCDRIGWVLCGLERGFILLFSVIAFLHSWAELVSIQRKKKEDKKATEREQDHSIPFSPPAAGHRGPYIKDMRDTQRSKVCFFSCKASHDERCGAMSGEAEQNGRKAVCEGGFWGHNRYL